MQKEPAKTEAGYAPADHTGGVRISRYKRWGAAWLLAILFHLAIIAILAWHLIPETMVQVSGMVPTPNETIALMPAQAVEPAVFFTSKPTILNGNAASLYRIESDGTRTNVLATLSEASTGERYTLTAFIQKIEVELF